RARSNSLVFNAARPSREPARTLSFEVRTSTRSMSAGSTELANYSRLRAKASLFLISFLILFFELACIRWFGSIVPFLAYFTNLILLASFLGMSVGCLAASRKTELMPFVLPVALVAVGASLALQWAYHSFGKILIDVGGQNSPQQIFFGAEYVARNPGQFLVPIELIAAFFFVLVSLIFIGLGQALGRGFQAIPHPITAYSLNVLGSLAGILAFGAASYMRSPPLVWFAVAGTLSFLFGRS